MKKIFPILLVALVACGDQESQIAEDAVVEETDTVINESVDPGAINYISKQYDYGFEIEPREENRIYSKDTSYTIYHNISVDTNHFTVYRDTAFHDVIHVTREAMSSISVQVFKTGSDEPIWNVKLAKEDCKGHYTYDIWNAGIEKHEEVEKTIDEEFLSRYFLNHYRFEIKEGFALATVGLAYSSELAEGSCEVTWKFPIETGKDPEKSVFFEDIQL